MIFQNNYDIIFTTITLLEIEKNDDIFLLCLFNSLFSCQYYRLEPSQYSYICDMPIKGIVALSDKFREWIKIGFYDFCHLYHTMKVPLDNEDIKELIRKQGN